MNTGSGSSETAGINARAIRAVGFWAAILTAFFYLSFDAAAISIMSGSVTSRHWISILSYLPSLFPALTFIVLMAGIHCFVPRERRFRALLGMAFAIVYATLNCYIYVIQVLVIAPRTVSDSF